MVNANVFLVSSLQISYIYDILSVYFPFCYYIG